MQYTRGKAGPVSRMTIEVSTAEITENGSNSRAMGGGVATLAGGRLKALEFTIQGRNLDAARAGLCAGGVLDVDARWTGGTAIAIKKVHGVTAGTGATPVAIARRSRVRARAETLFR